MASETAGDSPPPKAANVAVAKTAADAATSQSFRLFLLVLMVLQNSATVLVGRYTRASVGPEDSYVVNHLIVICEAAKVSLYLRSNNRAKHKMCSSLQRIRIRGCVETY
jgi:hypothetical protein